MSLWNMYAIKKILLLLWAFIFVLTGCAKNPAGITIQTYKYTNFYVLTDEIMENLQNHYSTKTKKKSIMNIGDSISESRGFMWKMRWAREGLRNNPKEGYVYIEKEISSRPNTKSAWGKQIIDKALENGNPEFATIIFGTNDLIKGGVQINAYRENMSYIIEACLDHGTIPLLCTIPPNVKADLKAIEAFNEQLYDIQNEKKVPLFDVYKLFLSKGDWRSLLSDGLHPNTNDSA